MRFRRGARKSLREKIDGSMFGDLATDVQSLVDSLGKRQLAEMMSGTTNRKSKAYRNARDSISRYLRGTRRPSAARQSQLSKAARKARINDLRTRQAAHVSFSGNVKVSEKVWRNGHMDAILDGYSLQEFLDAVEGEDEAHALEILSEEYGLDPDLIAEIQESRGFEFD